MALGRMVLVAVQFKVIRAALLTGHPIPPTKDVAMRSQPCSSARSQGPHCRDDLVGIDAVFILQHLRITNRYSWRTQARDLCACVLGHCCRNLRAKTGNLNGFMHHQQAAGAAG